MTSLKHLPDSSGVFITETSSRGISGHSLFKGTLFLDLVLAGVLKISATPYNTNTTYRMWTNNFIKLITHCFLQNLTNLSSPHPFSCPS